MGEIRKRIRRIGLGVLDTSRHDGEDWCGLHLRWGLKFFPRNDLAKAMDGLDVRIIRAMGIRPHGRTPRGSDCWKPAHIAQKVGVTEDTVRARVARMEETGLIAGYRVAPNLQQLGFTGTGFFFDPVEGESATLARAIAKSGIPGVMEVHAFLGRGLCVELAYPDADEAKRRIDEVRRLTGAKVVLRFHEWTMPEVARALTPLDWRIVRALRANGRRSLPEVADELGLSARTVKRRFERMANEGSVVCVPLLNLSKAEGVLLVDLLVHLRSDAPAAVLDEVVADLAGNTLHVGRPADQALGSADLIVFASTPADVEALRQQAASRPGVARAEVLLFTAIEDCATWVDDALGQLAALPA